MSRITKARAKRHEEGAPELVEAVGLARLVVCSAATITDPARATAGALRRRLADTWQSGVFEHITLGTPLKRARLNHSGEDYLRFASMPLNPFYILITTHDHALCFGLKATCADAMRKAGYEPNV